MNGGVGIWHEPHITVSKNLSMLFRKFNFNVLLFLPSSGESSGEIVARLKRDLLPTMINGIMYWPICDFITFKFIPVYLQVCVYSLSCCN